MTAWPNSQRPMPRGVHLALAAAAAGLDVNAGALVLGITPQAFNTRLRHAARVYKGRGLKVYSVIDTIRHAEAEGLIVAPRPRA